MKKNGAFYRSLVILFLLLTTIGISDKAEALLTARVRSYPKTCEVGETIEIIYSKGGLDDYTSMVISIYAIQLADEQSLDKNGNVLLYSETITDKSSGTISFKVGPEAGVYIGIAESYVHSDNWVEGGGYVSAVIRVDNGKRLKLFDDLDLGQSGWVQKNGKTYYGNVHGTAVLGIQEIDDQKYYFDGEGVLQRGWFKTVDGIWHYSNEQGVYYLCGNMHGIKSLYIPPYVDALDIYGFVGIGKDFYIQCEPNSYAETFAYTYCLQYDNGNKKVIGSNITSEEEKIKWILNNYLSPGLSDVDKAIRLYTWIQVNSTYVDEYYGGAYGILIDGAGVCGGYAEAFCELLTEAGIENKYIANDHHAWTLIRLNGQWYHSNVVGGGSSSPDIVLSYADALILDLPLTRDVTMRKQYYYDEYIDTDNNKVGWVKTKIATYYYDGRPENGGRVTGKYTIDDEEYFFDETGRLIEDEDVIKETQIIAYVDRCYQIILGRGADENGRNTWVNELNSGRKAAAEIIDNFVRSQEFIGKNYSNAEAVEILYKAMLGRGSDPAGKADWVGKLDAGHPFAVVINGFCGSKEFKEICDSYGIAPGSVSMEQGSASDQQIRAFVTRCYNIILGRGADEVGMNTWFSELKSRRRTAAEIIEQFVYSQEFQNKKYSNPDAVEILYKAMLGRGSDPAGKADWVGRLAGGQPLTAIINGFCGSMEFNAICEAYGITPGSVQVQQLSSQPVVEEEPVAKQTVTKTANNVTKVEIVNPSDTENAQLGTAVQAIYINEEKAKEFIGRCYRCVLGREASPAELDSWIGQMLNGTKTADQIARGFLFSGEFKDKNVSNEELVKILYRVYLNRDADAEGLASWTQKLDEGTSLQVLLDTFAKTNEFIAVMREMSK